MASTMSYTVKVILSRFLSGTGFSPARHASTFAELGSLNSEYFDVLRLEKLCFVNWVCFKSPTIISDGGDR